MATKAVAMHEARLGRGCLGKAHEDEPIFILRGQDALSGDVVRHWADLLEARTARAGELSGRRQEKIAEARRLAIQMDSWKTRKMPD